VPRAIWEAPKCRLEPENRAVHPYNVRRHVVRLQRRDLLSSSEAREIYEALGAVRLGGTATTPRRRFLKWNLKTRDPWAIEECQQRDLLTSQDLRQLKEVEDILSRKSVRVLEEGYGRAHTGTVWEAVLYLYSYLQEQKHVLEPKLVMRGQRNARWSISSSKQRGVGGDTDFFVATLPKILRSDHPWSFPPQLRAAAQHYGCPTDLVDFTMDPDIAAFFAVRRANAGDRGVIYVVDASCEGETRMIFLPPLFRRIHSQAGLFLQLPDYSDPVTKVTFEQHDSFEFRVFDTDGNAFDPVEDDGPVGVAAAQLARGCVPAEVWVAGSLEDYALVGELIVEAGTNILRGREVFNPEMVAYLVTSNVEWWRANIDAYMAYCVATCDKATIRTATVINEYLDELPAEVDSDTAPKLGLRLLWDRDGFDH
jgi:hypothetical protein